MNTKKPTKDNTKSPSKLLDKADKSLFNSLVKKASKPLPPEKKTKD